MEQLALPTEPRPALARLSRLVVDFAAGDIARGQLLFLRTVPGFTPSTSSCALAQRFQDLVSQWLFAAGATGLGHVDVYTALIAGLVSQQTANDPGGDRWTQHLDTVLELFYALLDRPHLEETT